MDPTYHYAKTTYAYHSNYVRNSKAIGVLWAIFTICFAIVNVLVFCQPFWIGTPDKDDRQGYFGLYYYCDYTQSRLGGEPECSGRFDDFESILSTPFKVATVLVGVSALLTFLCIACLLLFFFVRGRIVFSICATIQMFCFLCMLAACVIYPLGWDNTKVKQICGLNAEKYKRGDCEIRWAYILAMIGIFDALFLCILGYILGSKQVKLLPEAAMRNIRYGYGYDPTTLNGGMNGHGGMNGTMPKPGPSYMGHYAENGDRLDRISQFSTAAASSRGRPGYRNNFNL